MNESSGRNILMVVLDTVRKDHLTPYGYGKPTTPGLETFAKEATVYEQAIAPAPWTLPVHASMFTGLYPSQHGASQEQPYLPDHINTLAEAMSAAGYDTACYSSNAWITPYTRLTAGFDDQDNFFEVMPGDFLSGALADVWQRINDNDRMRAIANRLVELGNDIHEYLAGGEGADSKTPQVIDNTIKFVDEADDWFVFINLMDAHLPVYPPEEYREEFAPGVDPSTVCQNSKEYNSGAREISDKEFEDIKGLYDAEIRHMDDQLDRLFSWLKDNEEWEDTLVIVCADHGELHGEHGIFGHEFSIYDPLVNVPLLLKGPELGGGRSDKQIELQDLYHTILDYAGVQGLGEALDPTRSLLSPDYRDFDKGEYAFVEYHRPVVELNQLETKAAEAGIELAEDSRFYSRMRAARRVDGKYIRNERIDDEAYRIDRDPDETENLAGSDDEVLTAVENALTEFERRVGETWDDSYDPDDDILNDMDETTKGRLEDLGYIE